MKKVLVTGGTSKLGAKIVNFLHTQGYKVFIHFFQNHKTANDLLLNNSIVKAFCSDFTDSEHILKIIDEIYENFGYIDLLINNAAIFVRDTTTDFNIKVLQAHLQINATTPLMCIKHLYEKGNQAHVINMLDDAIHKHHKGYFSYYLSKKFLYEATTMIGTSYSSSLRINNLALGKIIEREETENISGTKLNKLLQTILELDSNTKVSGQVVFI